MEIFSRNGKNPPTRHQKGKRWATLTLLLCGSFSIWANVRSGQINAESVIVSVFPPVVAFAVSHLIAYFNPRGWVQKVGVYGILGLIMTIAMYGSGWHIFDYVTLSGQHWTTAIAYIFITDAPMLVAAGILVAKVPTTTTAVNRTPPANVTPPTIPAKKTTPAKTTKPAAKRTTPAKTTKPSQKVPTPPIPTFSTPLDDSTEKELLRDGASR